jgi:ferritin heavy chain
LRNSNQQRRVVRQAGETEAAEGTTTVTGIVFQPFVEMAPQLEQVERVMSSNDPDQSYARTLYEDRAEAAVNQQINIELNMSYVYTSMYAYFDRANVGLPGFAGYFRSKAAEETTHAQRLIAYQNLRGGRVQLAALLPPQTRYDHPEKGDALYAAELALSLEKLNFQKLHELATLAGEIGDNQMSDFVEAHMLEDQAEDVKATAVLVSELRRVGRGHGVWHIDHRLRDEYDVVNPFSERAADGADGVVAG